MRSTALGTLAITALALGALSGSAIAQYNQQTLSVPARELRFVTHDKLTSTPTKLGTESLYLAKFEPTDDGDYIWGKHGRYPWGFYVLEFELGNAADGEQDAPITGDDPEKVKEAVKEALRSRNGRNFAEWVKDHDPNRNDSRRFNQKGKFRKGSGTRPPSAWWEYYDVKQLSYGSRQDDLIVYKTACVYDLGDREIVLLFHLPLKRGNKPDSKYRGIAKRLLTNFKVIEVDDTDADLDARRDRYAVTDERQAALEQLKANIGNFKNWDYFTSPNYLFTFSWEHDKPAGKKDSYRFARQMEASLEHIREKYAEFYPPHEKVGHAYSVIRICHDLEEFSKYGNTPRGVVGWFSPASKELVIYYDKRRVYLGSEDEMLAVCYHEAWHQYSDQYWPGVELHRWFDEGLAEYFGTLRKKGRRWVHVYHKGRLMSLNRQQTGESLVPSNEIVTWHKNKFYAGAAADHYAQGYAMVDFLVRGKAKLGKKRWNDRWSEILPIYARICLEDQDEKRAVEEAFAGVDWEEFEAAWIAWFDDGLIKRA